MKELGLPEDLLRMALTHSSYAHEHGGLPHNERLEFLGDAVLELVISDWLYRAFPGVSEGELTARRAALVCESSLAEVARSLELGPYFLLGKGEVMGGGRQRSSLLAAGLEAVLGAVYLHHGLDRCQELIQEWFSEHFWEARPENPKAQLQELVQEEPGGSLEYRVLAEQGPSHEPKFQVGVFIDGELVAQAWGRSKKTAEKEAALRALKERKFLEEQV